MSLYYIVGAGGIGGALAKHIDALGHKVVMISRKENGQGPYEKYYQLDISLIENIPKLVDIFSENLPDYVVSTVGFLHDNDSMPEKNIQQFDSHYFTKSLNANLIANINLLKALDFAMQRTAKIKIMLLSARVSSISDNRLGGWYSYRMSKCALNMLIKNVALEWQRKFRHLTLFGYHPGTVDTALSKPFQERVPENKLFSTKDAATYLFNMLLFADMSHHGKVLDWKKTVILP